MTVVDVTEEAAEKARKWNLPIPKLITRWLERNEVNLCGTKSSNVHVLIYGYVLVADFIGRRLVNRILVQTAEEDPVLSHHPMESALNELMKFAGPHFKRQSETWSAALPNNRK